MPMTPTRSVGLTANWTRGLKTVAPAQNRGAGFGGVHAGGERKGPDGLAADALGETAVAMDDGLLGVGTEIMIAAEALPAGEVGT